MLIEVVVGAILSLVVLVGFLIRRAPEIFVAKRLAARLTDDDGKLTRHSRERRDQE